MLKIYNTLTRQTEELRPQEGNTVKMYSCGPTVYWFAHIGNMRAFLFADVLRRTIEFNGKRVKMVMNITDVGHLTDDEDAGEDKMIVAMQREGKTAHEIAQFYAQAFFDDVAKLNIKPADQYPKATEHIDEQIALVKQMEENGYTYQTGDGVYFDTSKLEHYGRLSGQRAEEKQAGARVEMGEKRHATDFALWKFSPAGQQREMEWDSPWGVGYPGWHLECSAMSMKYLGVEFDVHTGGIDHIPIHHENEIAQTQGATGKLQARIWAHSEFLTVHDGKMSKSLGNLYTLNDLSEKGFDPLAYRYMVLGAHYRTKLNFTFEALAAAQNALYKLQETVRDWNAPNGSPDASYEERFRETINNDLNTAKALAVIWELVDDAGLDSATKAVTLLRFDEVLGLGLDQYVAHPLEVPEDVQVFLDERNEARASKDWEASDRIRDLIEDRGFEVEDTPNGQKLHKKR